MSPLSKCECFSGLTRVVDTSLDDVIQGVSTGCLLVPQLAVNLLGQRLGHMVVVLGEVGELLLNFVVEFEVVVGVSERHDCFLTLQRERERERETQDEQTLTETLDPQKKSLDIWDILQDSCRVREVSAEESW